MNIFYYKTLNDLQDMIDFVSECHMERKSGIIESPHCEIHIGPDYNLMSKEKEVQTNAK